MVNAILMGSNPKDKQADVVREILSKLQHVCQQASTIKYVKLSAYVLFWPEFATEGCRKKRQAWMDLATLRAFLQE